MRDENGRIELTSEKRATPPMVAGRPPDCVRVKPECDLIRKTTSSSISLRDDMKMKTIF